MKKVLALVSVLVLVFALCSCQKNGDMNLLLNGEKSFIDFETGDEATIFTLSEVNSYSYKGNASAYAIVDLDDDGNDELLIEYDDMGDTAVLHSNNGKYTAYYIPFRGRTGLKEDGTMSYSSGASDSGIQRLIFTDKGMESVNILEHNTGDYIFTINGEKATVEKCGEVLRNQNNKKEVVWKPLNTSPQIKEDNDSKEEKHAITVDEFCQIVEGIWVNIQKHESGYECIDIVKEGDRWRYKYLVYQVACMYNMEIKEVKIANDTYKLTLYSPGGYNEMYDIYEDEEYRYVDVKIVDNAIIVDGTKEYTYFSDYSELFN